MKKFSFGTHLILILALTACTHVKKNQTFVSNKLRTRSIASKAAATLNKAQIYFRSLTAAAEEMEKSAIKLKVSDLEFKMRTFAFTQQDNLGATPSTFSHYLNEIADYDAVENPNLVDDSFKNPIGFQYGDAHGSGGPGGFLILKGNVFPVDYFARVQVEFQKSESFFNNVFNQPWYEWKNEAFTFHRDNASQGLFNLMTSGKPQGKTITVYRGTTELEAVLLKMAKNSDKISNFSTWKEELNKALTSVASHNELFVESARKALEAKDVEKAFFDERVATQNAFKEFKDETLAQLPKGSEPSEILNFARNRFYTLASLGAFSGVFFTPDKEMADTFSKGVVAKFDFSAEEFDKLMIEKVSPNARRLYIGFEKMVVEEFKMAPYIEIALFPKSAQDSTIDLIFHSFVNSIPVPPGQRFN